MKKLKNQSDKIPVPVRWTRQAALCYYLGFNCLKCDVPDDFKRKCKMKSTVIELVKEFGKPPERFLELIKEELSGLEVFPDSYIIDD